MVFSKGAYLLDPSPYFVISERQRCDCSYIDKANDKQVHTSANQ